MSRARSDHTDNLILIAATTLVILTAQRYFQTSAPEHANPTTDPAARERQRLYTRTLPTRPRAARAQPVQHSLGGLERYSLAHL